MIELSDKARSVIEAYMGPQPIAYGFESHSLCSFRNWCIEQFDKPQLVVLRNDHKYTVSDREKALKHMQDYFRKEPRVYDERFQEGPYVNAWNFDKKDIVFRYKCEKYLSDHVGSIAAHACIAKFGSVKTAFLQTENWIELWNIFEEYFEERRKRFMKKMELDAQQKYGIANLKTPSSHGGIANLLKVLTKTMEKQGASIESIAKVQYAICLQGGVYLPGEFLTDVAVGLDIENVGAGG